MFEYLQWADSLEREDYFRLFCIFNRLCDSKTMLMGRKKSSFLFGKFVKTPPDKFEGTFEKLADCICKWQKNEDVCNENYVTIIKKVYDDYVRDVIIESKVKFRLPYKGALYGRGSILKKTISITSRNLTVYEDEEDGLDNFDVPTKREPTGKIIHEMSLIGCQTKISPNSKGIFTSRSKKFDILSIRCAGMETGVDIMFDTGKEIYDVYAWTNAIQECIENINTNSNRLIRLQKDLLLESSEASRNRDKDASSTVQNLSSRASSIFNVDDNIPASESKEEFVYRDTQQYSDVPIPPNKPERKSIRLSTNRKSLSTSNLSKTENLTKSLPFSSPNNEYKNIRGFFHSYSVEEVDEMFDECSIRKNVDECSIRKNLGTNIPRKNKKIPPEKPPRKIGGKEISNKRYQAQYIDIHTMKRSESASCTNRAVSFADYGDIESDVFLSRHENSNIGNTDKNINENSIDEVEERDDKINKNTNNVINYNTAAQAKDNSGLQTSTSVEDMVNRYSLLIAENFDIKDEVPNRSIKHRTQLHENNSNVLNICQGKVLLNNDIEDNDDNKLHIHEEVGRPISSASGLSQDSGWDETETYEKINSTEQLKSMSSGTNDIEEVRWKEEIFIECKIFFMY